MSISFYNQKHKSLVYNHNKCLFLNFITWSLKERAEEKGKGQKGRTEESGGGGDMTKTHRNRKK